MGTINAGDVVRASFATSGRVLRIIRFRGQDTAVLDTGEGAHRKIPVDALTVIPTCENQPCQNPPFVPTRQGVWLCRECQAEARAKVRARSA
ncbi:MAG TPA: hypothetical protein VFU47_04840 [Armatimonadota bacterium]|nr:hypothetical protein [Armatimonadota bacterium]